MTIEELRVLITAKTESLQEGIEKAKSRISSFKRTTDESASSIDRNVARMKEQYDSLVKKLDVVNAQAVLQQKKLKDLREQYARAVDFGRDSPKAMRLQEQILNTESRLHRLISTSDKTAESIFKLEDSMDRAKTKISDASEKISESTESTKRLGTGIKRVGDIANRSTPKIVNMGRSINRAFMMVLRRIFVINLIYKMIRGFMNYLNDALRTNNRFASSLQTIRTNLRVAFQPIYDFVLPAINALMKWLATLTTYIAGFTSALFGKTYKQSYDAAKGIETAKKAMDRYGNSAKKAKGQLAAFDEINVIQTKDEASGGKSGFEMSMPEVPEMEFGWLDKLREKLEPTIQAMQRLVKSLEPMKTFVAQGVIDFYNKFLVPVGDWVFSEGLPRFIDAIANGLAKIDWEKINKALARLWEALAPFSINVGEGLLWLWESVLVPLGTWVGSEIVPRFLELLANVIKALNTVLEAFKPLGKWLWEEFLQPLAQWTGGKILEILDWLNEKLEKLSIWMGENKPLMESIATVVGAIAIAIGLVKGSLVAKTAALGVASGALGLFKGAIAALTSPIGITVLAIAGVIAILVGLWKTNEEFRDNIKKIWDQIKEIYKVSVEFIKEKVISGFDKIKDFWEKHGDKIKAITKIVWDSIGNLINSTLKVIQGILDIFIGAFTGDWNRMGEGVKKIWEGMWGAIKNNVETSWKILSTSFGDLHKNISGWFNGLAKDALGWGKNLISNFTDGIKSMISGVKNAVKSVADTVSNFLGFASPTKEGPGSRADKWMPNLMNMLADGIEDNVYKVSGAVNVTANTLSGIDTPNDSDSIASQIASIMTQSMGAMQNNNSNNNSNQPIILKIGETEFARAVIKAVNDLTTRTGETQLII